MRIILGLLVLFFSSVAGFGAHTRVDIVFSASVIKPGEQVWAAVRLQMDPGWHTYWRNSGESGIATKIVWTLPAGIKAGEISWPVPSKFSEPVLTNSLTTYAFADETILLVPLTIEAEAAPGALKLKAAISWLECQKECVPGRTNVQVELMVGAPTVAANDALFRGARAKLAKLEGGPVTVNLSPVDKETGWVTFTGMGEASKVDFFPYAKGDGLAGDSEFSRNGGSYIIKKKITKDPEAAWPTSFAGLIVLNAETPTQEAYEVTLKPATGSAAVSPDKPVAVPPASASSLAFMMGSAFLGGLILNVMPCVLPVIALKIFGFVAQSHNDKRRSRQLGLIYGLGVIASFIVLAGLIITVQKTGQKASWGMQMQNPKFLVAMTVLILLVALNLFGVFEVVLSGKAVGAADQLASKEGGAGAFFNGVLATILATPCTAPFFGAALAFAFTQSPFLIVLIFISAGLGLALPFVILSWNPALLKFLPKPGAWMVRFKVFMGFPMLATAIWLYTITTAHLNRVQVKDFGFFLVMLATAAWIFGEFVQRGRARQVLAAILAVGLVVGGAKYALAKPPELHWTPWSEAAVDKARQEGHVVLVDFTAEWCATCIVNRGTSIEIESVARKLNDLNGVAMIGDNTAPNEPIAAQLRKYNRAGVPLVLIFPADPKKEAVVLRDGLLTPKMVLDALDKAGAK